MSILQQYLCSIGSSGPPSDTYSIKYSEVGIASLVMTVLIMLLCMVYAVVLLFVNIYYRGNKLASMTYKSTFQLEYFNSFDSPSRHIKASTPKLNTVIIAYFVIILFPPLFDALVLSAHEYGISRGTGDVLCQVPAVSNAPISNDRIDCVLHALTYVVSC